MNMHGVMTPLVEEFDAPVPVRERVVGWLRRKRVFLAIVVLPLLVASAYLFLVASDQYESESHFLVRSAGQRSSGLGGFGELITAATGLSSTQGDAGSVSEYLVSHDAVSALERRVDLRAMFQRPEADVGSRLRGDYVTPERMLDYYRNHVSIVMNSETGIATLKVHTFRPEDALRLNEALLDLGEQRVNEMNLRSYDDALKMARRQLAEAEVGIAHAQSGIQRYRQNGRDFDPSSTSENQMKIVAGLKEQLLQTRAQLAAMGSLINRSSPQFVALTARAQSLQAQIATESSKLTGSGNTLAATLGGYEDLKLRQDFAAKRYEAAAANLERARADAERQQLYVVRVVSPNLPVKSTYPHSWRILATMAISLLVAYSIGWLIVAGVREHAA